MRAAVAAFRRGGLTLEDELRWFFVACHAAHDLWDDEGWYALSARHLKLARDVGALSVLPLALAQRVGVHLHTGEFGAAAALVEETTAITEAMTVTLPGLRVRLPAFVVRYPAHVPACDLVSAAVIAYHGRPPRE